MTSEQKARDMLERMGYDDAQQLSASDVLELSNLISESRASDPEKIILNIQAYLVKQVQFFTQICELLGLDANVASNQDVIDALAPRAEHEDTAPHEGCDCKLCVALREVGELHNTIDRMATW